MPKTEPMSYPENEVLNAEAFAALIGVSVAWVRTRIREGRLPGGVYLGPGAYVVRLSEVLEKQGTASR